MQLSVHQRFPSGFGASRSANALAGLPIRSVYKAQTLEPVSTKPYTLLNQRIPVCALLFMVLPSTFKCPRCLNLDLESFLGKQTLCFRSTTRSKQNIPCSQPGKNHMSLSVYISHYPNSGRALQSRASVKCRP
jgi:hypothetical protein